MEARPSRTPWITAASVLDDDTTESTGLFLAGAALIGLATTVRKISQPRPDLLAKTGVGKMAAGER